MFPARSPIRLCDRWPEVPADHLIADMVPPPRFAAVRFDNYLPDPAEPSQRTAVEVLRAFETRLEPPPRRWFRRSANQAPSPGVYLDGGYGVGKTHLLASLWHASPTPKAYCTFVELTHLVGALGFATTVAGLSGHRLLCIDEFELDDPGDTVLISTLLARLVEAGVKVAVTSNTLPGRLGEGRFAAQDFLREIQILADRFTIVRINGEDYRHRGLPDAPRPLERTTLEALATATAGAALDDFAALCAHLQELHPVRYGALVAGLSTLFLRDVRPVADQSMALRLVVLVDRLYDRDVPVGSSGVPLDEIFPAELLHGGFRKKYFRAVSRLVALAREGESAVIARDGAA